MTIIVGMPTDLSDTLSYRTPARVDRSGSAVDFSLYRLGSCRRERGVRIAAYMATFAAAGAAGYLWIAPSLAVAVLSELVALVIFLIARSAWRSRWIALQRSFSNDRTASSESLAREFDRFWRWSAVTPYRGWIMALRAALAHRDGRPDEAAELARILRRGGWCRAEWLNITVFALAIELTAAMRRGDHAEARRAANELRKVGDSISPAHAEWIGSITAIVRLFDASQAAREERWGEVLEITDERWYRMTDGALPTRAALEDERAMWRGGKCEVDSAGLRALLFLRAMALHEGAETKPIDGGPAHPEVLPLLELIDVRGHPPLAGPTSPWPAMDAFKATVARWIESR